MRTRRRNVTEDLLTIGTRRRKRLKTSRNEVDNSVEISVDIILEILLRLPAKSIAKCRCVSKIWRSLICRQDFTELFLTRSLLRPQLLFSFEKGCKLFFVSSPQLRNPVEKSSVTSLMSFHISSQLSRPVHGLTCFRHERAIKETVIVICNLSTGQALNLPKPEMTTFWVICSYLVYEPINKQFKVLLSYGIDEHQVLTFGAGELSWRMIECSIPHIPLLSEICINGVLYYKAINLSSRDYMIVCFDGISEKFSFITDAADMGDFIKAAHSGTLINYNGKLASLVSNETHVVDGSSQSIELWILQDAEEQVWSKHSYVLPACWEDVVGSVDLLNFVGVTRTNEIILSPLFKREPFYVFYFNIEKKTVMRVAMQGMEALQYRRVFTYLHHVENVKLMHMF